MIEIIAIALVVVAGIMAVAELARTKWQSLIAWGLLVLVISLLAERV
jgi:uncharacterized protein (DUF983 family)